MINNAKTMAVLLLVWSLLPTSAAYAQNQPPPASAELTGEEMKVPFSGSLFLSPLEIVSIQMALQNKIMRPEMLAVDKNIVQPFVKPPRRVIAISGVLSRAPGDWIVWMNGQKVTPKNLLPEIVDIKVDNSAYVSLKWYDAGLDSVISIRIRPQQIYDIETGILLPVSDGSE